MRGIARGVLALVAVAGAGAFPACSCEHSGSGGIMDLAAAGGDDAGVVVPSTDGGCGPAGQSCSSAGQCCSGSCDPTMQVCTIGQCLDTGAACSSNTQCCN